MTLTSETTHRQRLRQAGIVGVACLLTLSALWTLLAGIAGTRSALPLIIGISVVAAAVGAWVRAFRTPRALLLGVMLALAGCIAIVAYAAFALTFS